MSANYKSIYDMQQTLIFCQNLNIHQNLSNSVNMEVDYNNKNGSNPLTNVREDFNNIIDTVANWFLNMSSMSNKKLQKLCYYAYCWFIVLFNDIEYIEQNGCDDIQTLWDEHFQAWIHGPVLPSLYIKYKGYGWHDIPKVKTKPVFTEDIENLLQEVWEAYAVFNADELEAISQEEMPWKNARKNLGCGEVGINEISDIDILKYYSTLG